MIEKGDKIGDYTLVRFLGKGQFGEVWLAEKDLQFSKRKFQHALKFLFNLGDEINLKSAEAEIDTWIEASGHPNVMSVLDMLVHRDHVVIASEYAAGGSVADWLKRSGGKAPFQEEAMEMMTGILKGIEHLHARNIVHRDLKPDNILLQGDCPRIADFGISRIVSAGSMKTLAMGSPSYMSPESFDGSKSPLTDIWSAGVILYEMLSGQVPYWSDSLLGLVASIQKNDPKPLPESVSPELRRVVETALDKNPDRRFQTAADMRLAIRNENYNLKVRLRDEAALRERPTDQLHFDEVTVAEPFEGSTGTPAIDTVPIEFGEEIVTAPRNETVPETASPGHVAPPGYVGAPTFTEKPVNETSKFFPEPGISTNVQPRKKSLWILPMAVVGILSIVGLGGILWMNSSASNGSYKTVSNISVVTPDVTPKGGATQVSNVTTVVSPTPAPTERPEKPNEEQKQVLAPTRNKTPVENVRKPPPQKGTKPKSDDCIYNGNCGK